MVKKVPTSCYIFTLTVSRVFSLLFLCRLDVRSSGRMKSSAVVGRPGYKNTSSWSWGISEACSDATTVPPVELKFVLKLRVLDLKTLRWHCLVTTLSGYCHQSKVKKKKKLHFYKKDTKYLWLPYQRCARLWNSDDHESHLWQILATAKISEGQRRDVPVTELFSPRVLRPPSTRGCQGCARQEPARRTAAVTWRTLRGT